METNRPDHPLDETPPAETPAEPSTKPPDIEPANGQDPGVPVGPGKGP